MSLAVSLCVLRIELEDEVYGINTEKQAGNKCKIYLNL